MRLRAVVWALLVVLLATQQGCIAESTPLGIGRPASNEEIRRLDIDIMPDGSGLPAGSGTSVSGAVVYNSKCAACHGANGEGSPLGAPLVGRNPGDAFDFADRFPTPAKTIGNYWPYATTIFDYVRRAMPFDRPGSLTDDEVYGVTAWLLWKNDIIPVNARLDANTLPEVVMPAADRFIPDNR